MRDDVLHRDRFRCSICGKRRASRQLDAKNAVRSCARKQSFLCVDHIVPLQMGSDPYDKANLRTLCKDCHKAKTKLDRDALAGNS